MKITEKTFDASTGKETITERDETAAETAERLALIKKNADDLEAKQKAEAAREIAQTKLAALGLTADDLKALGL
jgi:aromatic ring hydroxylase